MKNIRGRFMFGFWESQPYDLITDKYSDFLEFRNTIDKKKVVAHIESLGVWMGFTQTHDIFTGEEFNCGFYRDGVFQFPVDFFRYYKTRNIGIPYEYEEYLKGILK